MRSAPLIALFVLTILAANNTAWAKNAKSPRATAEADEQAGAALERDLERRWGDTRAIQVVVDRLYPKARRFEMDLFASVIPNDPFLIYFAPGLRLAWHVTETWAIELGGAYSLGIDSGLRRELREADSLIQARLRDQVLARFGLAVLFSPVYGKMAFTNRAIGHFDLYFLAEVSGLFTDGVPEMDLEGGIWGGAGLGVGFRFFFSQLLSLRVELRQRFEVREGLGNEAIRFAWPTEVSLGLSFLLGRGRRSAP